MARFSSTNQRLIYDTDKRFAVSEDSWEPMFMPIDTAIRGQLGHRIMTEGFCTFPYI